MLVGAPGSGLSLTARVLRALGMDVADVADPQNRLLDALGRATFVHLHDLPLPPEWYAHQTTRDVRDELQELVRRGDERSSLFGVMDASIVRVLPMWHTIFRDLDLEPHYVFCVRNPSAAGDSLSRRGAVADPVLGEVRWLTYVMDFLRYTKGSRTLLVPYERWFSEPMPALRVLLEFCSMSPTRLDADLLSVVYDALDPRVRHSNVEPAIRNGFVRHVYDVMMRDGAGHDARADLDRLAEHFISFQHMMQPYARMIAYGGQALESSASHTAGVESARLREDLLAMTQRLADREAQLVSRDAELADAEESVERLTAALRKAVEARVAGFRNG